MAVNSKLIITMTIFTMMSYTIYLRFLNAMFTTSYWQRLVFITCFNVIGPMLRSLHTTSSRCTLIFFLIKRSRCFWFMHDAAWTWVSTCQSNTLHTTMMTAVKTCETLNCSNNTRRASLSTLISATISSSMTSLPVSSLQHITTHVISYIDFCHHSAIVYTRFGNRHMTLVIVITLLN